MKTKIIAIMGKAGSGKDTIATALATRFPNNFNNIVSCTTRPMREGEKEGINYFYLTDEEFVQRTVNGDMLETTTFNGWCYGTAKSCLSNKSINIGVFNPTGVRSLLANKDIDVTVFYVRAGDKTRLLRQLNREDNPNVQEIIRRFSADENDFSELRFQPDYELTNETPGDIQRAVDIVLAHVMSFETPDNFS